MPSKERIHVFYFIHDLAPFGAQRVVLHTVQNLSPDKFRVTVCPFWGDETLAPAFAAAGARIIPLRARRFLDVRAWLRLARLLISEKPDIIQTNLAEMAIPVRLLSLFLPSLHVVHSVQNPFSCYPVYWRLLDRATLALCDAIIFCSRSLKEAAGLNPRHFNNKSFIAQNGVSIKAAPAADGRGLREELGIAEAEKMICCVGRLVGQKGQDILIEAAAILAGEKRRLRYVLAGDGETLAELQAQAELRGVGRDFLFLGRRSDIARILSACDVYAAPSRWEGLNIALGEAMLAGKPCVATAIPGHADILKDGVTGVAVPVRDPIALAAGIAKMLDNPQDARKIAAAASTLIRTDFTVEAMAKKYEKIYLYLMGRPG
ncbi:MAG: glycosyltransferase [Elusimicrobiota bacterium]|nr:glycosyltransferase [Elusimicrobiota bacterium]